MKRNVITANLNKENEIDIVNDLKNINRRVSHNLCNIVSENVDKTGPPKGLSPRLILPQKGDELVRISEQEARVIYCSVLNNLNYFYSIETPTRAKYKFTGQRGISAASDLSIFTFSNNKFIKVANVEFKAHNPPLEFIKKDIQKLVIEGDNSFGGDGAIGNWYHTLKNADKATIQTLFNKFILSFDKTIRELDHIPLRISILFTICIMDQSIAIEKNMLYNEGVESFKDFIDNFFNINYPLIKSTEYSDTTDWYVYEI